MLNLRYFSVFYVVFMVVFATGCSEDRSNTLIVGVAANNKPFEFVDNGKIVGFDIDFANLLADRMFKKVAFKDIEFERLIDALNNKEIDMIVSAMTITEERKKLISFSMAYYINNFVILFNTQNPVTSIIGFRNKKIGVQRGTTMEYMLNDIAHTNSIRVVSTSETEKLVDALKKGEIDGVVMEQSEAAAFVVNSQDILDFRALENTKAAGYAVGLRNGSALISKVNIALQDIIDSREFLDIQDKWKISYALSE